MNNFRKSINYLQLFSAVFFTASLIFWEPMQRPAIALFFGSYLIEIFTDQKWKNIQFNNKSIQYAAMFFFFALPFIYHPFEKTSNFFYISIERRVPLFAFALIGMLGINKLFKLSYFLNTFIIMSLLAICYLAFYRVGLNALIHNPQRIDLFNQSRIQWVDSHMIFNFYLNISLISIWYILSRRWKSLPLWKRASYIGAMSIIFSVLSISEGRSGFLMSIILMFSFLIFEIWKRKKKMGVILAILVPFMVIGLASHKQRFEKNNVEQEPRLFLWHGALEVIKSNPVLGHGISDAQNMYTAERAIYETKEYREIWKSAALLDAHNQYLQSIMEFGIIGLCTVLFLFIYPIYAVDEKRRIMTVFIIATGMFQSLFDVFMTSTFSDLYGWLMILMLFMYNDYDSQPKNNETGINAEVIQR